MFGHKVRPLAQPAQCHISQGSTDVLQRPVVPNSCAHAALCVRMLWEDDEKLLTLMSIPNSCQ